MSQFKVGDKVSFGARKSGSSRKGWGIRSHIPRYQGTVISVQDRVILVDSPDYSKRLLEITLRKSGRWILKGQQEDLNAVSLFEEDGCRVKLEKVA